MVKVERTPTPPASLATEKAKLHGTYRGADVVDQLYKDFNGKCYLCEINELQSIEIEHLLPHHNGQDRDRMFEWNNLFLSCPHCNSVKNRAKYESNIIDCCLIDPETIIQQEFYDGKVVVSPLLDTIEATTTAELVQDCFELRNVAIRTRECQTRVYALQGTMNMFYKELEKYSTEKTERHLRVLRAMLNRNYRFSGFTRTYLKLNRSTYPELMPLLDD